MKNIICIVARTNSTRLKSKVLRKIGANRLIEHLIERMKLSKEFDEIYLCTSNHPDDKVLVSIAKEHNIKYIAGSELAVIERLLDAANKANADNIVRVTGDNPLTDPFILDDVLKNHIENNSDYSIMTFLPRGSTGDIIKTSALKKLYKTIDPNESQYLAIYINDPSNFNCNFVQPPKELFNPFINFSVDILQEFKDVSTLINKLGIRKSTKDYISACLDLDICKFPKETLIKISEEETLPYGEFIEWQIKKNKNALI
tara:strand:+ start:393 stop:1166 length:774 start_codon:yes stop_codon:yes gene_type:complete